MSSVAVYEPFVAQLGELRLFNNSVVFDYEDPKGNKEARSHIYKLRQTKAAIDKARKQEKAASLEYGRKVDAEAKDLMVEVQSMIDMHQAPINEIEERERQRVAAIQERITCLRDPLSAVGDQSAAQLREQIGETEAIAIDDSWQEFIADAAQVKDEVLAGLRGRLDARVKYESEQAELKRLREEKAEQERKEHEARIAREAEERALKEAKEAEKRTRDKMERKAQAEREAAEKKELKLKLAKEREEKRRKEAELRAAQAEKEAQEKAAREVEEARQRELQEIAQREADEAHRAKVNKVAIDAFCRDGVVDLETAADIVSLISNGAIPNVKIHY